MLSGVVFTTGQAPPAAMVTEKVATLTLSGIFTSAPRRCVVGIVPWVESPLRSKRTLMILFVAPAESDLR
jgi:hypothetical protein